MSEGTIMVSLKGAHSVCDILLTCGRWYPAYPSSDRQAEELAEAICEAVTRPTMHRVPIKRVEQQDLQALHRIRERLKLRPAPPW